jgi:hypothetical protein
MEQTTGVCYIWLPDMSYKDSINICVNDLFTLTVFILYHYLFYFMICCGTWDQTWHKLNTRIVNFPSPPSPPMWLVYCHHNLERNMKFLEELIGYSPLLRHRLHRKQSIQQFFYCCMHIHSHENMFTTVAWQR